MLMIIIIICFDRNIREWNMSTDSVQANEVSVHDMQWEGVSLTQAAADRVRLLSQDKKVFRLDVKASGCTGFAYDIKLVDAPKDNDLMFTCYGATFYVALNAMAIVDGTQVDFVRQGLNSLFVYDNPNVKNMCGCGESFGV